MKKRVTFASAASPGISRKPTMKTVTKLSNDLSQRKKRSDDTNGLLQPLPLNLQNQVNDVIALKRALRDKKLIRRFGQVSDKSSNNPIIQEVHDNDEQDVDNDGNNNKEFRPGHSGTDKDSAGQHWQMNSASYKFSSTFTTYTESESREKSTKSMSFYQAVQHLREKDRSHSIYDQVLENFGEKQQRERDIPFDAQNLGRKSGRTLHANIYDESQGSARWFQRPSKKQESDEDESEDEVTDDDDRIIISTPVPVPANPAPLPIQTQFYKISGDGEEQDAPMDCWEALSKVFSKIATDIEDEAAVRSLPFQEISSEYQTVSPKISTIFYGKLGRPITEHPNEYLKYTPAKTDFTNPDEGVQTLIQDIEARLDDAKNSVELLQQTISTPNTSFSSIGSTRKAQVSRGRTNLLQSKSNLGLEKSLKNTYEVKSISSKKQAITTTPTEEEVDACPRKVTGNTDIRIRASFTSPTTIKNTAKCAEIQHADLEDFCTTLRNQPPHDAPSPRNSKLDFLGPISNTIPIYMKSNYPVKLAKDELHVKKSELNNNIRGLSLKLIKKEFPFTFIVRVLSFSPGLGEHNCMTIGSIALIRKDAGLLLEDLTIAQHCDHRVIKIEDIIVSSKFDTNADPIIHNPQWFISNA